MRIELVYVIEFGYVMAWGLQRWFSAPGWTSPMQAWKMEASTIINRRWRGHPPCPKAWAPWFKARQNLRPICEKQNAKRKKKIQQLITPAKAIWVFHLSNESHLKVLRKCPTSWLHKCEVQTHLLEGFFFYKKLESLFLIGMQHKESNTQNGIIQNDNCIVAFSGY